MAKQKREKFMDSVTTRSPKGVGIWCHIKEADEYQGEAKFKITQKLPKEGAPNQAEIDRYVDQIHQLEAAAVNKAGKSFAEGSPAVKDGDDKEWKGEGDNPYVGHWLLTYSSKYQPKIYNVKGEKLTDVFPSGGDIVRIGVELLPYAAKARGIGVGVSLRLLAVQIIEKRARDYDGFEDESGAGEDQVEDGSSTADDDDIPF